MREPAVALLADAFADNPLNLAVLAGDSESRRRQNVHGIRIVLATALRHGLVLGARVGDELAGALVANPPFTYPFPAPDLATLSRGLFGQGLRATWRWATVFRALDAGHPRRPHWYLGTLGVAPRHQRRGVGRALLDAFCERVDAESMPAWLETDRERNLGFYGAAGFERAGELDVLGARIWRMSRPARLAAGAPLR